MDSWQTGTLGTGKFRDLRLFFNRQHFSFMKQNNLYGTASNELMIAAGERVMLSKRQNCMRQVRREKALAERRARRVKVVPIKRGFG